MGYGHASRVRGRFGRAIAVNQSALRVSFHCLAEMRGRNSLAPREQLAQWCKAFGILVDHQVEQGGGQKDRVHAEVRNRLFNSIQRGRLGWRHRQSGAVQKRAPNFKGRGVERNWRQQQKPASLVK